MQSAKETAANIGASAKSGMEKTKAIVQEKAEKMTAHDPVEKDMATQKKEERKAQAELNKMEAREHNAATKEATSGPGGMTHSYSTTGTPGYTTGPHQMSAVPGHGAGRPTGGHVTEGTTGAHPIGVDTGAAGRNPRAGSGATGTGTAGAGGAYRPI